MTYRAQSYDLLKATVEAGGESVTVRQLVLP